MNVPKDALLEETKRFEATYLWLEESMPQIFFQEVDASYISLIVHALMGFELQDYFTEIHLKNVAISLTLDKPDADIEILKSYSLYGIKNYTTYVSKKPFVGLNSSVRIAVIYFTQHNEPVIETYDDAWKKELLTALCAKNNEIDEETAERLFNKIDLRFLRNLKPHRQVIALELMYRAEKRDLCQYEVEHSDHSTHIVLAWRNTPKHNFLYRLAKVVNNHGLIIQRVNAAYINPYQNESIFLLSFALEGKADFKDFLQELVTLKYFGSLDIFDKTFVQTKLIRGNLANLLRALRYFIHQVLVNLDINLYNLSNIEEGLSYHPELTVKLLEAFEAKFHPFSCDLKKYEKLKGEFVTLIKALDTGDEYHDLRRKNIFMQALNFVDNVLKTNFYRNNKSSFSFRLDPQFFENLPYDRKHFFPELPFAVFFIKGMHFFGFHIRFRDLSRGGLRTVFPEKKERVFAEINTIFQECYNLALTQQKKNKDIPEGGAKGIIFLKPNIRLEEEMKIYEKELGSNFSKEQIELLLNEFKQFQKIEYLYETQRSFIKSFLTLINCEADGKLRAKDIVDYWKKPEYIYLGPDENMHDVMIEWIAEESKKENYKPKGSFISGKPKLGINHKQYGVTSLGVNVYMEEVLKYLGTDPKKNAFTVKMTGGPDGDVAGNQIANLYNYYPKTAKLIALTDVSGTIQDLYGLDLTECYKLFKAGKSINHYPFEKLSEGGFLLDREKKKEITPYTFYTLLYRKIDGKIVEEWLPGSEMNALFRNNVHQTYADIFIPCGGRPRTLRDTNWQDFLDVTQMPTAKAIIEGANLYLTPMARRFLEEKGVLIIKDSSANKGGVIASSFEILSGLTLSESEFLENKDKLVKEILERIAMLSLKEAQLMLATHKETKQYLTEISEEISKKINLYTDQLLDYFERTTLSEPLLKVFLNYAPRVIKENFENKYLSEIPENHKKAIVATTVASQLVYGRGLLWAPSVVDILPLIF